MGRTANEPPERPKGKPELDCRAPPVNPSPDYYGESLTDNGTPRAPGRRSRKISQAQRPGQRSPAKRGRGGGFTAPRQWATPTLLEEVRRASLSCGAPGVPPASAQRASCPAVFSRAASGLLPSQPTPSRAVSVRSALQPRPFLLPSSRQSSGLPLRPTSPIFLRSCPSLLASPSPFPPWRAQLHAR
jgi:hypothetical protein